MLSLKAVLLYLVLVLVLELYLSTYFRYWYLYLYSHTKYWYLYWYLRYWYWYLQQSTCCQEKFFVVGKTHSAIYDNFCFNFEYFVLLPCFCYHTSVNSVY